MRSFLNKAVIGAVAFGALLTLSTSSANAAEFASFGNAVPGTQIFQYDSATRTLTATNAQVSFAFYGGNVAATLNFTGTIGLGDSAASISNATFTGVTFSFIRNSDSSNLLSSAGSTGTIDVSGAAGSADGSTAATPADTVNYTSDYFDFSNTNERSYAFSFSGVTPVVESNTPANFGTSGTGTFSSDPSPIVVVPEANAGLLAGLALPLLGGIAVLRRRNK